MFKLILSGQDTSILNEIERFFSDLQLGMSQFQISHFVLNDRDFPLPFSKYRQAKLELWNRYNSLIDLEYDFKKTVLEQKKLRVQEQKKKYELHKYRLAPDHTKQEIEIDIDLIVLEREKKETLLLSIKKIAAEKFREMRVFVEEIRKNESLMPQGNQDEQDVEHWKKIHEILEHENVSTQHLPLKRKWLNQYGQPKLT